MKQIKDVHNKIKDLAKAIKICQMKTNMGVDLSHGRVVEKRQV